MSLLDPRQIHEVLRRETSVAPRRNRTELSQLLEENNLSAPEVLDQLSNLMRCGETEGNRLRAAELALKLNGLLTPEDNRDFTVIININDSQFTDVNPILIPR